MNKFSILFPIDFKSLKLSGLLEEWIYTHSNFSIINILRYFVLERN